MYGKLRGAALASVALALVAAGCGSSNKSSSQKVTAKPAKPSPGMMSADTGARLSVALPKAGAVVSGNSVPTDVRVSHFRVDCRLAGTPNRMGIGHYHIELDGSLINMFCQNRASVSLQNVKPGKHTLMFVPAEDDHADDLKAAKKVSFVYRPSHQLKTITGEKSSAKPSIRILSPKPGSTVHGSFDLSVAPKSFEFSCALYGKQDVPGYGHWHINVDATNKGMMGMGTMLGMSCQRTFHVSVAGIKPGKHTFFAILEDNQHAPTPGAQDSVALNVQ
jgi:hypothetical protein